MKRRIASAVILVALLSPVVGSVSPVGGEGPPIEVAEPEQGVGPGSVSLLAPFRDVLSGRLRLVAYGRDPRLGGQEEKGSLRGWRGGTEESVRLQAPATAALVPFRDPSPKFSRNILIPQDFSRLPFQTEPHLAVNPKDPDHLMVGMIDYNFPNVTSYVSIDGGVTWEGPFQAKYPYGELGAAGDPVVAFDREGNAYFSYISLDVKEFTIGRVVGEALVSSISISSSEDGGFTWQDPTPASRSQLSTSVIETGDGRERGEVVLDFLDKPWMALGPHPRDPHRFVIYVTYTRFTGRWELRWMDEVPELARQTVETSIEMVRSEDGGLTWSRPLRVSPRVRRVFGEREERFVQGSQPIVADDGTLYIVWMDTTEDGAFEGVAEIYVALSEDGGESFSRPARAAMYPEIGSQPRNAFFRNWGSAFPQVAAGPDGEVYILYASVPLSNPDDDGDIFFVRSLDRGNTWSRPTAINDDTSGRLQFFPSITVGPDGVLHAMWGDMRHSPSESSYHIYYTGSEDRGNSWMPNARVTDFPSNPNMGFPGGEFIGDYFSIKATEKDVYMVWADTRLGEFGPLNQKIAFSRRQLMPQPSIFISPPSGPGGQDVVVQGFSFQPDQDIFVEVGGVVVATGRTQAEGRFTSRIFIPISGEGAHQVRVMDASGNVATGSFFMDFGFGNIREVTRQLTEMAGQIGSLQSRVEGSQETAGAAKQLLEDQATGLQDVRQSLAELRTAVSQQQRQSRWWFSGAVAIVVLAAAVVITVVLRRFRWGAGSKGE